LEQDGFENFFEGSEELRDDLVRSYRRDEFCGEKRIYFKRESRNFSRAVNAFLPPTATAKKRSFIAGPPITKRELYIC